jgi:hypothetical protein
MNVSGWRPLHGEGIRLYSPLGLRLVDDFTGTAPLGRVTARLDREVSPGVFEPTDIPALMTPSSILTWPGLGRSSDPASAPARAYQVCITADNYRPSYLQFADGTTFQAPPWDDVNPPNPVTTGPQDLYLFPSTAYQFPTWVPVLRGLVRDAGNLPVPNVFVHVAAVEKTLTDERGAFSLPLRWATSGMSVDADDLRTGRTASHVLNLPTDLRSNLTFAIV